MMLMMLCPTLFLSRMIVASVPVALWWGHKGTVQDLDWSRCQDRNSDNFCVPGLYSLHHFCLPHRIYPVAVHTNLHVWPDLYCHANQSLQSISTGCNKTLRTHSVIISLFRNRIISSGVAIWSKSNAVTREYSISPAPLSSLNVPL